MKFPQFTKKDVILLVTILPALVVFVDLMLFGMRTFRELEIFLISSSIITGVFLPAWFAFTWIAIAFRDKFPAGKDTIKRVGLTITVLASLQAFINSLFFLGFDYFKICGYELHKTNYIITLVCFFFINVTVTLMHEGLESFEKWKATLNEAEKLKTTYARSQLLNLKSQVNPHFLFNCLNSLSSLIYEDEEKAESFLNELTKVYRYFLRDKEEQLISLTYELQFIRSYFYLLQTRYGEGIQLYINVHENYLSNLIPPLTIQVLLEHIFTNNTIQKENPLTIRISVLKNGWLQVENNVQKKMSEAEPISTGLLNISDKLRLLTQETIHIINNETSSVVQLPLIKREAA